MKSLFRSAGAATAAVWLAFSPGDFDRFMKQEAGRLDGLIKAGAVKAEYMADSREAPKPRAPQPG